MFFNRPSPDKVNKAITVLLKDAAASGGKRSYHFDKAGCIVIALGQDEISKVMNVLDPDRTLLNKLKAQGA